MSIPFAGCFFNRVFGGGRSEHGMIVGFVFSFSIMFESRRRWGEMSLYVLSQWLEAFFVNNWKKTMFLERKLGLPLSGLVKSSLGVKLVQVSFSTHLTG
jgi:hypothetical protein